MKLFLLNNESKVNFASDWILMVFMQNIFNYYIEITFHSANNFIKNLPSADAKVAGDKAAKFLFLTKYPLGTSLCESGASFEPVVDARRFLSTSISDLYIVGRCY